MKKLLIFLLVAALTATSVLLCACACNPDGEENTIRLCEVTHSIFYAPQYLAMSLGYFEEAGINIELTNGEGADKVMAALLSGEADVGLMGPEASIYVHAGGDDSQPMVFGQLTKRDGSFLLGRKSEPDFDWSNMHNKEVLMGRKGGVPAMTLQYILNQHGYIDGQNITMRYDIQFAMLAPAFATGEADYVPLFEPAATNTVNQGYGHIISSIGQESGEVPYTAYTAKPSLINEKSELLEKFLDCISRATDYLMENNEDNVAELLAEHFPSITKAEIANTIKVYKNNDTWARTPAMTEDSYNRLQTIIENAGELPARVPFSKVVNNTIANKVGNK